MRLLSAAIALAIFGSIGAGSQARAQSDTELIDEEPFALRSTAGSPRGSSSVTLWDFPEFGQTIDLGVTSLPRESLPQHQGRISFLNSSFFGIELRMSFDAAGDAAKGERGEEISPG